jgi:hypothetical protein
VSGAIDCARAEELLSDHLEGRLNDVLAGELHRHLGGCGRCAGLRETLAEVVAALRESPALEPPADLARRSAAAALERRRVAPIAARRAPQRLPALLQMAAALLLLVSGTTLLLAGPDAEPVRRASVFVQRAINATSRLAEKKDRLLEDLRLLRVVIAAAFEGRLDRVNERFEDYRRLLEKRRASDSEQKKSGAGDVPPTPQSAGAPGELLSNVRAAALVSIGGGRNEQLGDATGP